MSASIKLSHYLPPPSQVSPATILAVRARLQSYLQEWWPELDTRPNSVFGDLFLTPMATTMAALEMAQQRRDSDLNLANVARGVIFDPEFVDSFLTNFGSSLSGSVPASGLIKLTLASDRSYIFDADTSFTFNGRTFRVRPEEGNPVIIRASQDLTDGRRLVRDSGQFFMVLLPVTGPQGVTVADGTAGSTSWLESDLIGVTAVGDFDPGISGDSLPARAVRARQQFTAATLTSRAGAESFVRNLFPSVAAVSVVVTGDQEMIRDGQNVLAVSEGALDVYVRSRPVYTHNQVRLRLAYDDALQAWVGALPVTSPPAFFSASVGVFRADQPENSRSKVLVYARSLHEQVDGLGVAYSEFEQLGLEVTDEQPSAFIEAVNGTASRLAGLDGCRLLLSGSYRGSRFGVRTGRRVTIRFDRFKTDPDLSVFTVRDLDTGETGQIQFEANSTYGRMRLDELDARKFFNGLELHLSREGEAYTASDFSSAIFEVEFSARSAEFVAAYQFDTLLPAVSRMLGGDDAKPVGVSVMAKSFVICHLNRLTITYRAKPGVTLDQAGAREAIADYFNRLTFPDKYDSTQIGLQLLRHGADSLSGMQVLGRFYPSLAHVFVDQSGIETDIDHPLTTDLLPPPNDLNYGRRNIAYLIEAETIQFVSDAG